MSNQVCHTLESIAERLEGEVIPPHAKGVRISGIESLEHAGPDDITFINDPAHARRWSASRAAAAIITSGLDAGDQNDAKRPLIVVPDAELALIRALELFQPPPPLPEAGVHPTVFVDPTAQIGEGARIGPHVSIERGAVIGARSALHAGVRIYPDVTVGEECVIHSNTVIRERCVLGNRVVLHQNVSIGSDGFGYRPNPATGSLMKMPHLGCVVIEDDVEIGSATCVDRGKFPATATTIGSGTKIDNLVQIAHNCRIGRHCVIAGMTGLAGSVVVGDGVQIGARAGCTEHVRIGDGARIGALAGVMRDVAPGETVYGVPAGPRGEKLREAAALRKLPGLLQEMSRRQDSAVES